MPVTTKDRRRANRKRLVQRAGSPLQAREYNYVLQISPEEMQLLGRYEQVLAQGAARFAEIYYNYLFDNPAIADVLYSYERSGGNIGDLVRSQLQHLLAILKGSAEEQWVAELEEIGIRHFHHGVRPVWMLGGYRLYQDHLQQIINEDPSVEEAHREPLKTALMKLVMRDFGIVTEHFWLTGMERVEQERDQLADEQKLTRDLLDSIPQMLWSVDVGANRMLFASPQLETWMSEEALEAPIPCMQRVVEQDQERLLTAWQHTLEGQYTEAEARVFQAEDDSRWYRFQFSPCTNRRGRVLRIHGFMEDINESRNSRDQLEHGATQDSLTSLANRAMWYDHLNTALAAAKRNPGAQVAVMVLDINQFKMYNDTLGNEVGDKLLQQLAGRLSRIVRDSDTLARLGSDEFGIVLPALNQAEQGAERVAKQILSCFDSPFAYEDRELCLSGAVGIAVYPEHGDDAHAMLSHADSAMYRAKRGGQPFQFYEASSDATPSEQLQLSGQLHGALEREEFELHYQPQVDVGRHQICGAEALLRWKHPEEGLVLPRRFITLAEQLGLITPITDWVLVTALQQCREWSRHGVAVPVSVNVSTRSFQNPGLVEKVEWALQEAAVEGTCLELEITEETLMSDLSRGSEVLGKLADLGVAVAIDDFGTGYSSLAYLKRLPIQTLKIDRSFLSDMSHSEQDAAIVRSIIDLGHNLGCKVIAEGVEDAVVWDLLEVLGCDAVQGYHVSRPLPERGFANWVNDSRWSENSLPV